MSLCHVSRAAFKDASYAHFTRQHAGSVIHCLVQLQKGLPSPSLLPTLPLGLFRELCTLDESAASSKNRSVLRTALPSNGEAWHPLYSFKRDLVQLLGNLLYRCKEVQDWTRERGGVSLLLNQCGIDHRNPCILSPSWPFLSPPSFSPSFSPSLLFSLETMWSHTSCFSFLSSASIASSEVT